MQESYCGIYCGACLCNIALASGDIEAFARKHNRTVKQLTCTDCKTAKYQDCCFVVCCTNKGLNNCSECSEMPCEELTKFANDGFKHHATTIPNLLRIREIGVEAWLQEEQEYYTCPECGVRTGWTYTVCEVCGATVRPPK